MSSKFSTNSLNVNDDIKLSGQIRVTDYNIPYKRMGGYPKLTLSDDGNSCTEEVIIQASDWYHFWDESFPQAGTINGVLGLPPRRTFPGTNWVTRSLQFEPFPDDKPWDPFGNHLQGTNELSDAVHKATYANYCKVTIEYRFDRGTNDVPPQDGETDNPVTYITHTGNVGGMALTISPDGLKYAKTESGAGEVQQDLNGNVDAAALNPANVRSALQPIVKLVPTIEHNLSLTDRVNPPFNTMLQSAGKVNQDGASIASNKDFFGLETFTAKGETVLFMGFSFSKKVTTSVVNADAGTTQTQILWDIDLRFKQMYVNESGKVYGWNHVWSPTDQKWVRALRQVPGEADKGKPLYETANFDTFL